MARDGKNILNLIKRQRITLDNPAEFGEFTNDKQFVTNYKKAISKIRAGEDLEGGRRKSKFVNLTF